jgi:hypothetical protein
VGSWNRKDNIAIPRGGLGTEEVNALYNEGQASLSPSHTVGLEPNSFSLGMLWPAKSHHPPGGLRNESVPVDLLVHEELIEELPSHAVGSEQGDTYALGGHIHVSPSHTVGLEGGEPSAVKSRPLGSSPSHTVGLEHQ